MKLEKLRRTLGFVILLLSSLTYLSLTDTADLNFATAIGLLLLAFAWTDYFSFIIYVFLAFGAIAGFFIGNLDGVLYGTPTGLAFVLFAALVSHNRERLATLVFLLSLPLALVNSYLYPVSSPINWALVGLMVGIIENAVVEEMAEGDVFIIALYFMALGPLAFIPTALQAFTGKAFFEKRLYGGVYYPVGPAMFVVAVPLFLLVPSLVGGKVLPEWLFYAHFHGVQSPGWAVFAGLVGTFGLPHLLKDADVENVAGGTMGAIAGLITGLLTLVVVGLGAMYVEDLGRGNLAGVVALAALLGAFMVGMGTWAYFSELHYEGESSIPYFLWFWGLNALALLLSVPLLREAWRELPAELALPTGVLTALLFLFSAWEEREYLGYPWLAALTGLAFISGLWAGFGLLWILL